MKGFTMAIKVTKEQTSLDNVEKVINHMIMEHEIYENKIINIEILPLNDNFEVVIIYLD